jgi:hypothetical protein
MGAATLFKKCSRIFGSLFSIPMTFCFIAACWGSGGCSFCALKSSQLEDYAPYQYLAGFSSLPRHGNADCLLRRYKVIEAHGILSDGELHALDDTVEFVPARPIVR